MILEKTCYFYSFLYRMFLFPITPLIFKQLSLVLPHLIFGRGVQLCNTIFILGHYKMVLTKCWKDSLYSLLLILFYSHLKHVFVSLILNEYLMVQKKPTSVCVCKERMSKYMWWNVKFGGIWVKTIWEFFKLYISLKLIQT